MSNGDPILSVLIVDDEEPARLLLRELLADHPRWRIIGEAKNGFDALQQAKSLQPDMVLLDVQMPKLDGFEVLELLDPTIAVVFTTAYDQYALRAFDVNAVDYLLKPFSPERFAEALSRAESRVGQPRTVEAPLLARAARPPDTRLERIVVKDGAEIEVIAVDSIDYVQSRDDYVELYCGERSCLKQQTMHSLAADLDPQRFVRIHRSYLLNIDRLARIEAWSRDSKVAVLRDGRQLPISRAGEARLKELLAGT